MVMLCVRVSASGLIPTTFHLLYHFELTASIRRMSRLLQKDPRFFTPDVDDARNIIDEGDEEEHSRTQQHVQFDAG